MGQLDTTASQQNQNGTTIPDATQQAFNLGKLNQLQGFFGSTPLGSFAGSQPGLYGLTPTETQLGSQFLNLGQPGGIAGQAQNYLSQFPQLSQLSGPEQTARTQGLANLGTATQNVLGAPGQYQQAMNQWTNPEAQIAAAQDYFSKIAGPTIANNLTASGLGRSGAQGEAMALGGAQLALPIAQQTQMLGAQGANNLANLNLASAGMIPGLTQYDMNLAGMPRTLQANALTQFGVPMAQGDLANLSAGLQVAGMPRTLSLQDFLRQQNLATSLFTGIPVATGNTVSGQTQVQNSQNIWPQILSSLAGGAASGIAGGFFG